MTVPLSPELRRLVDEKLRSGHYASPEDVLQAALAALEQQDDVGDFAPGELARLVREGDDSIRRHGTVTLDAVLAVIDRRRH